MSADNYIGYYKDNSREGKQWCVGMGFASPQMEDCQYRANPTHFFEDETSAVDFAMQLFAKESIVEYGVEKEADLPQEFCGHCYACVHDRPEVPFDQEIVEKCNGCPKPISSSETRILTGGGVYHDTCEPGRFGNPKPSASLREA